MTKVSIKITLLGDGAVGKTSLKNKYMGRGFKTEHLMTIGADFASKNDIISYNGKEYEVNYIIWDMAGQKRFQEIRGRFFQGSMGGLCVFDITRPESFNNIPTWIEDLWRNNGKGPIPIVLIGNKSDLRDRNSVPYKRAEEYAQMLSQKTLSYGFRVPYVETSAKDGVNIDEAFLSIGQKVFDKLNLD